MHPPPAITQTLAANCASPAPETSERWWRLASQLVDIIGGFCAELGVPRSYGRIFGFAYVAPRPVSFHDIVSGLGISKGSASQGLRWLRSGGFIHRLGRSPGPAGIRREYFTPDHNVGRFLEAVLLRRLGPPLNTFGDRLAEIAGELDRLPADSEDSETPIWHMCQQVRRMERWRRKTGALSQSLSSGLDQ